MNEQAEFGLPPKIQSPKEDLTYIVRASEKKKTLALQSLSEGDVRELFWFVNDEFVGRSTPQETTYWEPRPGRFWVRVVDDHGRSDSRFLQVSVAQ